MPEQLLDCADVVPSLEQMGCKAVPERMAGGWTRNAGRAGRVLHPSLKHRFVQVMPPPLARCPININGLTAVVNAGRHAKA